MTTLVQRIKNAYIAHRMCTYEEATRDGGGWHCACGLAVDYVSDDHERHVAEQLAAVMFDSPTSDDIERVARVREIHRTWFPSAGVCNCNLNMKYETWLDHVVAEISEVANAPTLL